MFRQIEKLQKTVNSLLGLCHGDRAEEQPQEDAQSVTDSRYERLGMMLLQLQDGELEERYFLRMEKWLLCDPTALRYYVDFQSLTALLHMHFNPQKYAEIPGLAASSSSV